MRCVIDLQGAQGESRVRGIGRYTLNLSLALAQKARGHEVWLALSGAFPAQVEPIRAAFQDVLPQDRIVTFGVPAPCSEMDPANEWRARTAEKIREGFLAGLQPDVVFLPSLFEGWCDDSVTSVGAFARELATVVVLYDLIPLVRASEYLTDNRLRTWYHRKLSSLRQAELLTAISDSSRREAIENLRLPEERVVNIGCGVDAKFRPVKLDSLRREALYRKYGIEREFVMYSGAVESRKNLLRLMQSFSLLPAALQDRHQLVIVGGHNPEEHQVLLSHIETAGLQRRSVVLGGYVPDEDLIALYSECRVFVLPSLHEGFGLPAAEAMACGAAAIGSNTTSIPEVIGRADALFDPYDPPSIAAKMKDLLTNDGLRQQLREHGLLRSKRFTWEDVASRAWEGLEGVHERRVDESANRGRNAIATATSRPRMAFFSPLAPVPSGIADYSAELLPALSRHYEIEVIVFQSTVEDAWVQSSCPVRSPDYFEANRNRYDRLLYQMGNSPFHAFMWKLMERYPGVVVLHDFYQSNLVNWVELDVGVPGAFERALYESHGYGALLCDKRNGRETAVRVFPCNWRVLDAAAGVIVHSQHSVDLAEQWYGKEGASNWAIIPQLRTPQVADRKRARKRLGLTDSDYVVCSFGMIADTKLNHRLIHAWAKSALARDPHCRLVFVGEMHAGEYGRQLQQDIKANRLSTQVSWTGFAEMELFRDYLAAADQAVQLRAHSRGETSRTVLDCMAYAVPVIVNAHGSLRDLPGDAVLKLRDDFDDDELAAALELLRGSPDRRRSLGTTGEGLIRSCHSPEAIAAEYSEAIERFALQDSKQREERLIGAIGSTDGFGRPGAPDLIKTADAIALGRSQCGQRQLLCDVSATAKNDLKTGIERVTKAVITESIQASPEGFRIEPVRSIDGQYRYARTFTQNLLGLGTGFPESPVEVHTGDIYLALDWSPEAICSSRTFFDDLRARGVRICFVVHDLLPLRIPHRFPPGIDAMHREWFECIVAVADKLIAVSRAVADDVLEWLEDNRPLRSRPMQVCYWRLGADIQASASSEGLPLGAEHLLESMLSRKTFLMVGTMEPRKGHEQTLLAFEELWAAGADVNLVLVAKPGWMMEGLVQRIQHHSELGKRLFWLVGISDEMLLRVYENASALIAASEGEGFGLPLIEAARAGIPIIARDLPVFREVAGGHAFYFSGTTPLQLASSVQEWLHLSGIGNAPKSSGLQWIGWKESARHLMDIVLSNAYYRRWPHLEIEGDGSDGGDRSASVLPQHNGLGVSS